MVDMIDMAGGMALTGDCGSDGSGSGWATKIT
jgi:hypothetical protein